MPRNKRTQATVRQEVAAPVQPASPGIVAKPPYVQYSHIRADRSKGAAEGRIADALRGFGKSVQQVAVDSFKRDVANRHLRGQADAMKAGAPQGWMEARDEILQDPARGEHYWKSYSKQSAALAAAHKTADLSNQLAADPTIRTKAGFAEWYQTQTQEDIKAIQELDDPEASIAYLTRLETAEIKMNGEVAKREADDLYMQTEADYNMMVTNDLDMWMDTPDGNTGPGMRQWLAHTRESGTSVGLSNPDINEAQIRAVGERAVETGDASLLNVFEYTHEDGTPGLAFTKEGGAMVKDYRTDAEAAFTKGVNSEQKKLQARSEVEIQGMLREGKNEQARVRMEQMLEDGRLTPSAYASLNKQSYKEDEKTVRVNRNLNSLITGAVTDIPGDQRQETIDTYAEDSMAKANQIGDPEKVNEMQRDVLNAASSIGVLPTNIKKGMQHLNTQNPEMLEQQLEMARELRATPNLYNQLNDDTKAMIAVVERMRSQGFNMTQIAEMTTDEAMAKRKKLKDSDEYKELRKDAADPVNSAWPWVSDVANSEEVRTKVGQTALDHAALTDATLEEAFEFAEEAYKNSHYSVQLANGDKVSVYHGVPGAPMDIEDKLQWSSDNITEELRAATGREDSSWYLKPDPRNTADIPRWLVVDEFGTAHITDTPAGPVPYTINQIKLDAQYNANRTEEDRKVHVENMRKEEEREIHLEIQRTLGNRSLSKEERQARVKELNEQRRGVAKPKEIPSQPSSVRENFTQDYRDYYSSRQAVAAIPQTVPKPEDTPMVDIDDFTKRLVDQIADGEGTTVAKAQMNGFASPYDVPYGYGKYGAPEKPISSMTLSEVKQYQKVQIGRTRGTIPGADPSHGTSAVGKFQIIGPTLRNLQERLNLSDSDVFSPQVQDDMARELMEDAGLSKFLAGEIDRATFQRNLAKVWASIADPETGKSAHGQPVGSTLQEMEELFK